MPLSLTTSPEPDQPTAAPVWVLKLGGDDPDRELEFEIDFLLSLSCEQRVELMLARSELLRDKMRRHEHPDAARVLKRQ